MIISVDAMGGDEGPEMVIPGLNILLVRQPDITFLLFGEKDKVEPVLAKYPKVATASEMR
ncbi:MAG: phosphate acyltransferase, partial [Hyphomicrobiales bacterium]